MLSGQLKRVVKSKVFLIILLKHSSEKLLMPKLVKKHDIINILRVLIIMVNHQVAMAQREIMAWKDKFNNRERMSISRYLENSFGMIQIGQQIGQTEKIRN